MRLSLLGCDQMTHLISPVAVETTRTHHHNPTTRRENTLQVGFDPRRDLIKLKVMHEVGDPVSRKDLEMLPLVRFSCLLHWTGKKPNGWSSDWRA